MAVTQAPTSALAETAAQPRPYSLLSLPGVVQAVTDERWANGLQLRPVRKGWPANWAGCLSVAAANKAARAGMTTNTFAGYALIAGEACTTRGLDLADFRRRASESLVSTEAAGVEDVLMNGPDVDPADAAAWPTLRSAATVVGGNTAHSTVETFALLENSIATELGSRGVIHASPSLVTAARRFQLVEQVQGHLETINGTYVVAGAGYANAAKPTAATTAAAGTVEYAYATGLVAVYRGPVFFTPDDDTAINVSVNLATVFAERLYAHAWDTSYTRAVVVDRAT